ncbi:MAG: sugar transferase, partial [Atribacterota bacterium]
MFDVGTIWHQKLGKRLLDLILAAVAMVVLSPVIVVVASLIYFTMGRPVLFRQRR